MNQYSAVTLTWCFVSEVWETCLQLCHNRHFYSA